MCVALPFYSSWLLADVLAPQNMYAGIPKVSSLASLTSCSSRFELSSRLIGIYKVQNQTRSVAIGTSSRLCSRGGSLTLSRRQSGPRSRQGGCLNGASGLCTLPFAFLSWTVCSQEYYSVTAFTVARESQARIKLLN